MKRMGGCAVVAAALAGAAAAPAAAMIGPACTTRLVAGTTGSCSFDTPYDWATITVAPVGTVKAGLRCFTTYGYTYTSSRMVSKTTSWAAWTPGSCSLTLTAESAGASAVGSATPTLGPIIDPYPVP